MKKEIAACVCLIALFLGGCATMASIDQQIAITSQPEGADVRLGDITGVTPMTATVPGGYSIPQSIQITKEGFQPQTVQVQRGFRKGALVQDIFPGVFIAFIPLIVDAITGDWWYVANSSYHVRLQPMQGSSTGTRSETK